jgi:ureidoacrylate peracid hydrolase
VQIGPERTALIVVDMQNAFCHKDASFTKMGADMQMCIDAIPGCRRLIDAAHGRAVPAIFLRAEWRSDFTDGGIIFNEIMGGLAEAQALVTGTWDAQIIDELAPEDRDYVIVKNRFSGFCGTQLEPLLSSLRIERLVVCGVTTNICVESTVRDAAQRDYRCFVVKDAVGEVDKDMHAAGLRAMEYGFAKIVTVDDVLTAWNGQDLVDLGAAHDSPGFLRPGARPDEPVNAGALS